ncbi:MAG: hypothetical protein ACTHUZ_11805, partial [Brachybacterium alimentarium]
EEETATEEASADAAADGKGAKDSPYATGETFTIDDGDGGTLDVTLGEVDWDATSTVMDTNQFNTEPADDETYVLVPLEVTYHGDSEAEAYMSVTVEYLSNSGESFTDQGTVTPHNSIDVDTLTDGDTGKWDMGLIVPKDQIDDGMFSVQALLDFEAEPVWVAP